MILSFLLFLTTAVLQPSPDTLLVINGRQGGIGISFENDGDYTKILSLTPGGSAEGSGLVNLNDWIVGVDKYDTGEFVDVKNFSESEVGNLIGGTVGAKVGLALRSATDSVSENPRKVRLVRRSLQRVYNLGQAETWYFSPGDSMVWASPEYDHSSWVKVKPQGHRKPLPDSLWNKGFGWFRSYFIADSNFYANPWYAYVYTRGAAELYIDGKLIHSYGNFSADPNSEKGYNPLIKPYIPLFITPSDTHLVAVRFSYHEAKKHYTIMGDRNDGFVFNFAFLSQAYQNLRSADIEKRKALFFLLSGVYAIIFILHGYLFYLFREQKENLLVTLIVGLMFYNNMVENYFPLAEYGRMMKYILVDHLEIFRFTILFLFPYTIVRFFNLHSFEKLKFLPLLAILFYSLIRFFGVPQLTILLVVVSLDLVICSILVYTAYKQKAKGLGFVAVGFIGMIIHIIVPLSVSTITGNQVEELANSLLYSVTFMTIIPVSMTLLIAYKMANLYTGLEDMVEERTEALETSLSDLKSTQSQLVHAEKMASLGELTAGIAHEIQNPLNFVNNCSDLNNELIDEQLEEIEKGDFEEVKELAITMKENASKIVHHGKRAGDIVKSMLQHSRTDSGVKEPTDINSLADEYLRLSYHGLRAKDKSFNAEFKADLDPDLPKVNVIPQDMGRVLLNLINNAFQACATVENPLVQVSTKRTEHGVRISVSDNGSGIPDEIKDKIFQPFFTTKPTGQGTGLGLSLSYDIVKAHGGTITLESSKTGTTFTLVLPLSN